MPATAPSASHFRELLKLAGIPYRDVTLNAAKGVAPSVTVSFHGRSDAQTFHKLTAAISSAPANVPGRGWVVIVRLKDAA